MNNTNTEVLTTAYEKLQELLCKVENIVFMQTVFDNIEAMQKERKLKEGIYTNTSGYYSPADSGGAKYLISSIQYSWSIPLNNGLFANIVNTDSVNYRMFGAYLDGINDDNPAMIKAHMYCNENKVELVNNFGTLYKLNANEIEIKYDVNLNGTTILIDNENCGGWYRVVNDVDVYYSYEDNVNKTELIKDTSYITNNDNALPVNSVLHIKDNNAWATRNDSGDVYAESRGELAFHTSWGNFTGSLTYGYDGDDTDLYFKYSKYNNKRLHFKGCNLRIETSPNITINFLVCTRHNTVIEDFVISPKNNATPNRQYHGAVLMIQDAYNTEFKNIVGAGIAGSPQYPDRKNSGYVLRLLRTFKTVISNCDLQGYWGVMGTACVKDLTIKDSTLNRIDVHNYFSEIFIQNVKLYDWGIDIGCGTGNLTFNNCKFVNLNKPNWGGQTIVNVNNTYGHLFDGTIIFRDCEVVKGNLALSLVKVNWVTGTGAPRAKVKFPNLIIDNLMIRNMETTAQKVSVFRFNGTSEYATGTTKVERANFINLNNIYYLNKDGSYGGIKFLTDETTTDEQFSTDLTTNITISNIYSNATILSSLNSTNKFISGANVKLNDAHLEA